MYKQGWHGEVMEGVALVFAEFDLARHILIIYFELSPVKLFSKRTCNFQTTVADFNARCISKQA